MIVKYRSESCLRITPISKKFSLFLSTIFILTAQHHVLNGYAVLAYNVEYSMIFRSLNICHYLKRRYTAGKSLHDNIALVSNIVTSIFLITVWNVCCTLLLQSGDIHPNPGPDISNDSSISSAFSSRSFDLSKYFSFVHYNVQSVYPKLELLSTELTDFDILAFSETWLGPNILNEKLNIPLFSLPERKDRSDDNHGGVIIYVKNHICYKRRLDLEPNGIECTCIWIEIKLKCKSILFGLFYRPPNTKMLLSIH